MAHIVTDAAGKRLGVAGAVIDLANGSPQPSRQAGLRCRGCGGTLDGGGTVTPPGWYQISVGVPKWLAPRGFRWVGLFCSVGCIEAAIPGLEAQERLAREVYDPVPPQRRTAR